MNNSRHLVIVTVGCLSFAACASVSTHHASQRIKYELCYVSDADLSGERRQRDLELLSSLGEPGRRALLDLLGDEAYGGCAADYAVEVHECLAVPILRRRLQSTLSADRRRAFEYAAQVLVQRDGCPEK